MDLQGDTAFRFGTPEQRVKAINFVCLKFCCDEFNCLLFRRLQLQVVIENIIKLTLAVHNATCNNKNTEFRVDVLAAAGERRINISCCCWTKRRER